MQTKIERDEIESFLTDASFIRDGYAERVVLPEGVEEGSEIFAGGECEGGSGTGLGGGDGHGRWARRFWRDRSRNRQTESHQEHCSRRTGRVCGGRSGC